MIMNHQWELKPTPKDLELMEHVDNKPKHKPKT